MKYNEINDEWLYNNCKDLMEFFFSMNENIDKNLFNDHLIDFFQNMVVVYYQSLNDDGTMKKDFIRNTDDCYAIICPDDMENNVELDGYKFGKLSDYITWKNNKDGSNNI